MYILYTIPQHFKCIGTAFLAVYTIIRWAFIVAVGIQLVSYLAYTRFAHIYVHTLFILFYCTCD